MTVGSKTRQEPTQYLMMLVFAAEALEGGKHVIGLYDSRAIKGTSENSLERLKTIEVTDLI